MTETDPEKRLIGYACISTHGQMLDTQLSRAHLRRRRRSGVGRLTDPTAAAQLWLRAGSSCPIPAVDRPWPERLSRVEISRSRSGGRCGLNAIEADLQSLRGEPEPPESGFPHPPPSAVNSRRHRRRGSRRDGGSRSCRLADREAQTRQEQFAVLGVAPRQLARHDERGDGAQLCNDRARFVEMPHMGIARGESAVWGGIAWMVVNGQEQLRRRFVKPVFEEMGLANLL